jgi:hypothetical protein
MNVPSPGAQSITAAINKSGGIRAPSAHVLTIRLSWIVLTLMLTAACGHHVTGNVHVWRLRGRVLSITGDTLEVRHKSGQHVTIGLDDRTEYYLNRKPDSSRMIHRDTRVTIAVETSARGNRALRIDVYR